MKSLGSAATDDERAVEAAIGKIDAWKGLEIRYQRILAGITNVNWKIAAANSGEFYFLKVPGAGTELFIDRKAAHDANLKAAALGIGPQVKFYLPDDDIEIFEFLGGYRSCTVQDFLDPGLQVNTLRAFKRLHAGPSFTLTKTYFDMIDEHHRQALELGAPLPRDIEWMMWHYKRCRQALEAAGLDLVPCMNDTYVIDFMANERKEVKFVDFEYASNNDRCSELAIWFCEVFFSDAVENQMLEEYFGSVRPEIKARVAIYKGLLFLKWTMWATIQCCLSTLAFDFYKYSSWLALRARHHMRDWRWEEYLSSV
jgi:thiamine kinase-like enzyme